MANVIQKLTALVEQEAPAFGLFLVAHSTGPAKLFQFYMDSEEPLSMKALSDFTRHISQQIDEEGSGLSEDGFTFEISSPGAERPLVNRKQYTKHVGRSFDFILSESTLSGKLQEIREDDTFVIIETVKEKGKKSVEVTHEVPFANIQSATIIISFK
jgi:ribosome maturation factor RimP